MEWPLYVCQQLLSGPFSTICTNQWKWTPHPTHPRTPRLFFLLNPIHFHLRPPSHPLTPSCTLKLREQSPLLLLLTPALWQVNVVSEENVPRWQHSLQGDYYPWFIILIYCGGLRISRLQLISSSHSLSALCSSFYHSPSPAFFLFFFLSSLCPALAKSQQPNALPWKSNGSDLTSD